MSELLVVEMGLICEFSSSSIKFIHGESFARLNLIEIVVVLEE